MPELKNLTKEKLAKGELALGVGLRQARSVDIGKTMKTAGFDWLFIDMEHNTMDMDMACQISVAAHDAGITPIVRVPGFEHYHATRALDGGAISKLQDGDVFRVDAITGDLDIMTPGVLDRDPVRANLGANEYGLGRELFAQFRRSVGTADTGASVLF